MAIHQFQVERRNVPVALVSLILGVIAFGIIILALLIFVNSPIQQYLMFGIPINLTLEIPLAILASTVAAFGFGILGIVSGCSSLPKQAGEPHAGLCKWVSGIGMGISMITILIDFILIALLRVLIRVP